MLLRLLLTVKFVPQVFKGLIEILDGFNSLKFTWSGITEMLELLIHHVSLIAFVFRECAGFS
jgi:hypothetical protein